MMRTRPPRAESATATIASDDVVVFYKGGTDGTPRKTALADFAQEAKKYAYNGRTLGLLGDSITARAYQSNASLKHWQSLGYGAWLRQISGQALALPSSHIFATSGITTAQLISAHLANAVAAELDYAAVLIGTNDIAADATSSTVTEGLEQIYSELLASGVKLLIAIPILPRSGLSATRLKHLNAVNTWIRNRAMSDDRIIVPPVDTLLTDATSADGSPRSGIMKDGLHPTPYGAYLIAKCIWDYASPYIAPSVNGLFANAGDIYDASLNPGGNLLTNGLLNGTGGSKGTTVSGTVADSWAVSAVTSTANAGDLTATCSKVERTGDNNGDWQQIVLEGAPAATFIYQLAPSTDISSNFSEGDTVYLTGEIEVDAAPVGLLQLAGLLACNSTVIQSRDFLYDDADDGVYGNTGIMRGVFKTEPFVIPSGATTLNPRVNITVRNGIEADATVRVGRLALRKVI